jgi:predicted aldo/keto reductase-like oxidoreductase
MMGDVNVSALIPARNEAATIAEVIAAYEDLLTRTQFRYVDVGMIHYVDDERDFDGIFHGGIIEYAKKLQADGIVRCLGISTHNPVIALNAVESGLIDVILFSINAAYDMLPAGIDVNLLFEKYLRGQNLRGY